MQELHTRTGFSLADLHICGENGDFLLRQAGICAGRDCCSCCATIRNMGRFRAFVRASIAAAGLVLLLATPAFAQVTGSPAPKGGLCAPWHRCVAYLTLGVVVLYILLTAGMYALQRRGFDKVEHRQGNPDGVPTKKD
jgi:hypothetical protein